MSAIGYPVYSAMETAELLPFDLLVQQLKTAVRQYGNGQIVSPERSVTRLPSGGLMLSMPSTSDDIVAHKLVNVCSANRKLGLPTIFGTVTAFDPVTGAPLFVLDGPTVTGRRTAAVTMLAISVLLGTPRDAVLIGTGKQAAYHAEAFAALFPDTLLLVKGTTERSSADFVDSHRHIVPRLQAAPEGQLPDNSQLVITLTTSKTPVYSEPARADRLVVGVGAFTPDAAEVGRTTIQGSTLVVDDPAGARHEAGDLIQAGVDWSSVKSLADVLSAPLPSGQPVFFKSVGCSAWDLAACRVARDKRAN